MTVVRYWCLTSTLKQIARESHIKVVLESESKVTSKFEMLREIFQDKLDILLVSETKVDLSFSSSQFALKDFNVPFRLDRNSSGGGTMLFAISEF